MQTGELNSENYKDAKVEFSKEIRYLKKTQLK